jgi:hypothetical protein
LPAVFSEKCGPAHDGSKPSSQKFRDLPQEIYQLSHAWKGERDEAHGSFLRYQSPRSGVRAGVALTLSTTLMPVSAPAQPAAAGASPSWHDGGAKQAISHAEWPKTMMNTHRPKSARPFANRSNGNRSNNGPRMSPAPSQGALKMRKGAMSGISR